MRVGQALVSTYRERSYDRRAAGPAVISGQNNNCSRHDIFCRYVAVSLSLSNISLIAEQKASQIRQTN